MIKCNTCEPGNWEVSRDGMNTICVKKEVNFFAKLRQSESFFLIKEL